MRLVKVASVGSQSSCPTDHCHPKQNQGIKMRKIKAICAAAILGLALSIPAYAGDIDSPGCATPGDIGTLESADNSGNIMLDILLGVISLF
jgi:hypothetical protein